MACARGAVLPSRRAMIPAGGRHDPGNRSREASMKGIRDALASAISRRAEEMTSFYALTAVRYLDRGGLP